MLFLKFMVRYQLETNYRIKRILNLKEVKDDINSCGISCKFLRFLNTILRWCEKYLSVFSLYPALFKWFMVKKQCVNTFKMVNQPSIVFVYFKKRSIVYYGFQICINLGPVKVPIMGHMFCLKYGPINHGTIIIISTKGSRHRVTRALSELGFPHPRYAAGLYVHRSVYRLI
jgi:hypothetical protein